MVRILEFPSLLAELGFSDEDVHSRGPNQSEAWMLACPVGNHYLFSVAQKALYRRVGCPIWR